MVFDILKDSIEKYLLLHVKLEHWDKFRLEQILVSESTISIGFTIIGTRHHVDVLLKNGRVTISNTYSRNLKESTAKTLLPDIGCIVNGIYESIVGPRAASDGFVYGTTFYDGFNATRKWLEKSIYADLVTFKWVSGYEALLTINKPNRSVKTIRLVSRVGHSSGSIFLNEDQVPVYERLYPEELHTKLIDLIELYSYAEVRWVYEVDKYICEQIFVKPAQVHWFHVPYKEFYLAWLESNRFAMMEGYGFYDLTRKTVIDGVTYNVRLSWGNRNSTCPTINSPRDCAELRRPDKPLTSKPDIRLFFNDRAFATMLQNYKDLG